jgi:hypothetical protein
MQLINVLLRSGRRAGALVLGPALLTGASAARADLVGANFSVAAYCCTAVDPADRVSNIGIGTVPTFFPNGSFFQTGEFESVVAVADSIDIDSDQITVVFDNDAIFAGGSFNGLGFTFSGASVPPITNVTVNP